jgi:hypothetical protein
VAGRDRRRRLAATIPGVFEGEPVASGASSAVKTAHSCPTNPYHRLHKSGALTDEQSNREKAKLLAEL